MRTNTNNIYRDKIMSDITEQDVGSNLKIAGWVENIRDHGGVSFIDLRDMYGVMQVVMRDTSLLDGINKEDCISVEGEIEHRDEETYNPKIPTGTIELEAHHVDILGKVYRQLPFEIATSKETREDVRLKYRYLDLRNIKVRDNMIFRSKVISYLREKMTEMGFLEIQTPILCASSPEGARDYIVPSRKFKGKFYALPQAPQQYKQLLMASGFDKYFQIAPCFRDEDARGDRSPGEFYQLDMEMAFASQEDVFAVLEDVLPPIFAKYGAYNVASSAPFRRIPYRESMEVYGCDKPDLRIDLRAVNVSPLFAGSEFAPLADQTVIPTPGAVLLASELLAKGSYEQEGVGGVILVDIGGATTDIHSALPELIDMNIEERGLVVSNEKQFSYRTVEGNLGLRVSATGIPEAVGDKAVLRAMDHDYGLTPEDVENYVDLLEAHNDKFDYKVFWGCDLQTEHERYLTEQIFKRPVFVTDYPKEIKAFYMKLNPDGKTVAAMDCLVPGIGEIIGGSQREDNYDTLLNRMNELGLKPEDYQFYLDLRKYGSTRHAGFGLGFERCVMYLTGISNIRDVLPFPRTVGNCDL